jgi:hypothetical protein
VGACIVLLTWSREERSERFGDPRDVRILVPFVRWNDGLLPLEKRLRWRKFASLNDDYVLMRGDAKICFTREQSDLSERFTYISTAWR